MIRRFGGEARLGGGGGGPVLATQCFHHMTLTH